MTRPRRPHAARRPRPVPRSGILAGLAVALLVVAGIAAMTEWLRHPPPETPGQEEIDELEPSADPRDEVVCEEEGPAEDDPLDDTDGPAGDEPGTPPAVSSSQLFDCPAQYDGALVRFQGEAIGAVLRRDGGAWVQLNDDVYADVLGQLPAHREYRGGNAGLGVFVPTALADQISVVGGPEAQGDLVEVVGVFRRADPDSGEVAVIRASSGEVVRPGTPFADPLLPDRVVVAALLAPLALAAVIVERLQARRR